MTSETSDVQRDLGDAVTEAMTKHGEMVARWVVAVETIDHESGERGLWGIAMPGMKVWDTLGMLSYLSEVERASILRGDD